MRTREDGLTIAFHIDRFRTSSLRLFLAERNLETGNIELKSTNGRITINKGSTPPRTFKPVKTPWSFYTAGILLENDNVMVDLPQKQLSIMLNTGELTTSGNRIDLKQDHLK
jgi:hypothetical protein